MYVSIFSKMRGSITTECGTRIFKNTENITVGLKNPDHKDGRRFIEKSSKLYERHLPAQIVKSRYFLKDVVTLATPGTQLIYYNFNKSRIATKSL